MSKRSSFWIVLAASHCVVVQVSVVTLIAAKHLTHHDPLSGHRDLLYGYRRDAWEIERSARSFPPFHKSQIHNQPSATAAGTATKMMK